MAKFVVGCVVHFLALVFLALNNWSLLDGIVVKLMALGPSGQVVVKVLRSQNLLMAFAITALCVMSLGVYEIRQARLAVTLTGKSAGAKRRGQQKQLKADLGTRLQQYASLGLPSILLAIGFVLLIVFWLLPDKTPQSVIRPEVQYIMDFGVEPLPRAPLPILIVPFVVVDTRTLAQFSGTYKLVLISRVEDPQVDALTDTAISISGLFSIAELWTQIHSRLSEATIRKLIGQKPRNGWLQMYVLIVPDAIDTKKITSVSSAVKSGGIVLAKRDARAGVPEISVGPSAMP